MAINPVTADQVEFVTSFDEHYLDVPEDERPIEFRTTQYQLPPVDLHYYLPGIFSLQQANTNIIIGVPPLVSPQLGVAHEVAKLQIYDDENFLPRFEVEQRFISANPKTKDLLVKIIITSANLDNQYDRYMILRPVTDVKEEFLRSCFPGVDLKSCIGPNIHLLQFRFAMKGRSIHAQNLFVKSPFGPEFDHKLKLERKMLQNGKPVCFSWLGRYPGDIERVEDSFETLFTKWYSKWYPGKTAIQSGVMANTPHSPVKQVPNFRIIQPLLTFPELDTYVTIFSQAVVAEQKALDLACKPMDIEFRLAINPLAIEQRVLFLAVPYQPSVTHAEPLMIKFQDADDEERWWAAQPIEASVAPVKYMYFNLHRPFYKEDGVALGFDDRKFEGLPTFDKAETATDVNEFIDSRMPIYRGRVKRIEQNEHTKHLITALRNLHEHGYSKPYRETTQMLLGNAPSTLRRYDLFHGLNDRQIEFGNATFFSSLTPSQLAVLQPETDGGLRRGPSRNACIAGPAGTGKTRLLIQVALMLNSLPKPQVVEEESKGIEWDEKEKGSRFRTILYIAPTNNLCVDFCRTIDTLATLEVMGREIMVTRYHPFQVEQKWWQKDIIEEQTHLEVFQNADASPEALAEAFKYFAPLIAATQKAEKFEHGVRARQLKLPRKSVGYNMLLVAGELPEKGRRSRFANPVKHADWKATFGDLKLGYGWPADEGIKAFTLATDRLRAEVIRMTDYNVMVSHQAGVPKYHMHLDCDLGIQDEAPKVREPDSVMERIMISCRFWVSIGDSMQGSTYYNPNGLSHFGVQLSLSLFHRLFLTGFPIPTLIHQHRMVPRIANVVSKLSYNDTLLTPDKMQKSAMNVKALDTMEKITGLRDNIVWLNVDSKPALLDSMTSKFNERELEYTVHVAFALLDNGYAPEDITIMCPYVAHVLMTRRALQLLNEVKPGVADIAVLTFDTFQGGQTQALIVPFVVGDRIGFLRNNARINVTISRARALLCFIGNADAIKQSKFNKALICKVLAFCLSEHLVVDANEWDLKPDATDYLPSHIFSEGSIIKASKKGGAMTRTLCRQPGHKAKGCTAPDWEIYRGRCKQKGHRYIACDAKNCRHCDSLGHIKKDGMIYKSENTCGLCKERGHPAKGCLRLLAFPHIAHNFQPEPAIDRAKHFSSFVVDMPKPRPSQPPAANIAAESVQVVPPEVVQKAVHFEAMDASEHVSAAENDPSNAVINDLENIVSRLRAIHSNDLQNVVSRLRAMYSNDYLTEEHKIAVKNLENANNDLKAQFQSLISMSTKLLGQARVDLMLSGFNDMSAIRADIENGKTTVGHVLELAELLENDVSAITEPITPEALRQYVEELESKAKQPVAYTNPFLQKGIDITRDFGSTGIDVAATGESRIAVVMESGNSGIATAKESDNAGIDIAAPGDSGMADVAGSGNTGGSTSD